MRKFFSILMIVSVVGLTCLSLASTAKAEEVKMVGVITKIDIAGKDAKTAIATLKDNKTSNLIEITVNDDLTLDKFKDHRIVEGDEIRCKYDQIDGKNVSKYFRKTAGC